MALLPDFTFPDGDWSTASMAENYLDTSQYGFDFNSAVPHPRIYTQEQVWFHDPSRRRFGSYGVQCTGYSNATNNPNNTSSLDMSVVYNQKTAASMMTEGDEEWFGMSYYFPANFTGGNGWGILFEFATGHPATTPRYGTGWDAMNPAVFKWHLSMGHHPSPGAGQYNPTPPNGYLADEPLLGTGAPIPFTKDVWHDFYCHMVYQARSNGVAEIWHREGTNPFQKLYSNKNDGTALINRAPHPTWYYNDQYGTPGEAGDCHTLSHRLYRGSGSTTSYWIDGPFRRQSEQAILSVFGTTNPFAPTISGFAPTSGAVGTEVTITGTNFNF